MKNYKHFPTLLHSSILCLIILVISVLISILISSFNQVNNSILMIWLNLPLFALIFIIGMLWSGQSINVFIKNKKIKFIFFVPLFITTIGFIIIIGEITNILFYFYPIPNYILNEFENLLSNKWGVIAAIFIAAITEEFFFRGMILSGLKNNYGYWVSIMLSAFLFAFIHVIPWQIVPAFFAGIFLGWIYIKFESIILRICIHAFNNALAAIPEYYNFEIPGIVYDIKAGVQFQGFWINSLGIILFLYGLFLIHKIFNKY